MQVQLLPEVTQSKVSTSSYVVVLLCFIVFAILYGYRSLYTIPRLFGEKLTVMNNTNHSDKLDRKGNKHHYLTFSTNPNDPKFYNILLEQEALQYGPCTDESNAASAKNSKVIISGGEQMKYQTGDVIMASIIVYDGKGKRKFTGGDHFRAIVENPHLHAAAPCAVFDNGDGTHTIKFKALWSGRLVLTVYLSYTREIISLNYRIKSLKNPPFEIHLGKFMNRQESETTMCYPDEFALRKIIKTKQYCKMAFKSYEMSYFCEKPRNQNLSCQHWTAHRLHQIRNITTSSCENSLIKRGQQQLQQVVYIKVIGKKTHKGIYITNEPLKPCTEYNLSLLWDTATPTGFSLQNKWIFTRCQGLNESFYMSCLTNKNIYLLGDSTLRQWYYNILDRFKSHPTERKLIHTQLSYINEKYNFKAVWSPHSMPIFLETYWSSIDGTLYSISRCLDNIPPDEHAIVILHIYLHMLPYHHSVFKQRMKIIRNSVEKCLKRNKNIVIMIKSPHAFTEFTLSALVDYKGKLFSYILYEVFKLLHDKVVLLNNWDITFTYQNKHTHPSEMIVNAMVNQMLNHACHL